MIQMSLKKKKRKLENDIQKKVNQLHFLLLKILILQFQSNQTMFVKIRST